MITAKIYEKGNAYRLEMAGHAEFQPGNDIVCAGASAIVYALLGYVHNAEGHLAHTQEERVESGHLVLHCTGDGQVGAAFRMATIGLLQIAEGYPKNICVSCRTFEDGLIPSECLGLRDDNGKILRCAQNDSAAHATRLLTRGKYLR